MNNNLSVQEKIAILTDMNRRLDKLIKLAKKPLRENETRRNNNIRRVKDI